MSAAARQDFLVEIGTEELPPQALPALERAFRDGIVRRLAEAKIAHGEVKSYAAPRRLAVLVRELATRQPDQELRRKGPPVSASKDAGGAWTKAAQAFAQSNGVAPEQLVKATEGKGEFLFFIGTKAGAATGELLPDIVRASLGELPTPKRMRWGSGDAEFVRPVHWVVMLFGQDVIPAGILGLVPGRETRGHRFHAPKPIAVAAPADYADALAKQGHVMAEFAARRARVREQVLARAAEVAPGGRPLLDEELLDEVTALVEWPVGVAGRFEERFLPLPREVLISTLQEHQRYFPVEDASGRLTPWFVTVSNIDSRDFSKVREGNERVVRPRLSDAAFFYEQDRRKPLVDRLAGLDAVTFQAKLGSIGDKVRRVQQLAAAVATSLHGDRDMAIRAAALAKCDLLSSMVGEFPELQGIMGAYYAAADGEPAEVATAVREHYQPRGAGDELPHTLTGAIVGIADRLDTLAGIFATGQKPSGAKDPFGLRRAAIGVLRIAIEKRLDIDLRGLIEQAVKAQPVGTPAVADEVYGYVMERLRAYYLEGANELAITAEMFDAVLETRPRSPLDFDTRLKALVGFLKLPEAASLTAANKRIANILKKSDTVATAATVDAAVLREPAEVRLYESLRGLQDSVAAATERREYAAALGQLAQLRPTVDGFFDEVMVNDPDPKLRANRLALLGQLRQLFGGIADLSRLPG